MFFFFVHLLRLNALRSSNQIFIVIKFHFVIIYQSERDHLASACILIACAMRIFAFRSIIICMCPFVIGPELAIVRARNPIKLILNRFFNLSQIQNATAAHCKLIKCVALKIFCTNNITTHYKANNLINALAFAIFSLAKMPCILTAENRAFD